MPIGPVPKFIMSCISLMSLMGKKQNCHSSGLIFQLLSLILQSKTMSNFLSPIKLMNFLVCHSKSLV